eukprot:CAMPEP_0169473762 /NCGR_PEP_ID=MMETSP1042-20121227/25887_1 /TAXON_ID=464988 /ORGANISM="Hemiselmis andersenii, Strain CCMP1180" /LENGTH=71 /DNA_ID=CAMNT_0009587729 /DNA_START=85 /DNA_END=300 /DNA_ORIENTATION=-
MKDSIHRHHVIDKRFGIIVKQLVPVREPPTSHVSRENSHTIAGKEGSKFVVLARMIDSSMYDVQSRDYCPS